jgi:hypothetical protein
MERWRIWMLVLAATLVLAGCTGGGDPSTASSTTDVVIEHTETVQPGNAPVPAENDVDATVAAEGGEGDVTVAAALTGARGRSHPVPTIRYRSRYPLELPVSNPDWVLYWVHTGTINARNSRVTPSF